jgi:UDP-N-acetylglucosamine--N-acetylmuramyl-(pentapeptide) pyrophosphoryl-undecaprenol N-acetylglucosamine transferase
MKILFAGGGSGGPVAPLLAIAGEIKKTHLKAEFLLIGTKNGPERLMAGRVGISFQSIVAGKWRRYFSPTNFLSPFLFVAGFFGSLKIIHNFKPDCVLGAGSFVQVPVIWAAWFLRVPIVIHQQDIVPGLANRLCQWPADKITVTFNESLTDFASSLGFFYKRGKDKVVLTGNPFRSELKQFNKQEAQKHFHLDPGFPTLLVLGGGTGAEFVNNLLLNALPELSKTAQIIHSTGLQKGKQENRPHYQSYEFISEMGRAYAAADIVLSRAGLSTITELSNLGKVSIIIPIPGTHQETNAYFLYQRQAAIVLDQSELNAEGLVRVVRRLLFEHVLQQNLILNIEKIMPKNSAEKIAGIVVKLAELYS